MPGYPVEILAPSGALKTYIMAPAVQASANLDNAAECISDAVGFKMVQIMVSGITSPSAEALVAAFSVNEADRAAVKAVCDEIAYASIGKYAVPTGVPNDNALVLPLSSLTPAQLVIEWDGTNPIKTVGLELTGSVVGLKVEVYALRAA